MKAEGKGDISPGPGNLPWVSGSLVDRLGALVAAVVVSDRWATDHGAAAADRGWQGRVWDSWWAAAAPGGDRSCDLPAAVQGLQSPAAVALGLLPHLWQQADALGHRRAMVGQWLEDLRLSGEAMDACLGLHRLLCAGTAAAGPALSDWGNGDLGWGPTLGPAIALVEQTQGYWPLALAIARRRGWDGAAIALMGGLGGWVGGPASLAAALRQRWLCPAPGAIDPWGGVDGDRLDRLAQHLYRGWAGVTAAGVDQVWRL